MKIATFVLGLLTVQGQETTVEVTTTDATTTTSTTTTTTSTTTTTTASTAAQVVEEESAQVYVYTPNENEALSGLFSPLELYESYNMMHKL